MNNLGLNSQEGQEIFLSPKFQRVALVVTQSPIKWVLGVLSTWVKQLGGVKLTPHFHLVQGSSMKTDAFYASYMTTLPLRQKYVIQKDRLNFVVYIS
jgi:hypothetical protein